MTFAPDFGLLIVYEGGKSAGSQTQHFLVKLFIGACTGKIIKRLFGFDDYVIGNKVGTFGRALLGMLQTALPFKYRPAVKIVLGHFTENCSKIHVAISE